MGDHPWPGAAELFKWHRLQRAGVIGAGHAFLQAFGHRRAGLACGDVGIPLRGIQAGLAGACADHQYALVGRDVIQENTFAARNRAE